MKLERSPQCNRFAVSLFMAGSLACLLQAQAQPTLISVNPPNMATGVSTTTTVVFTFSEAMDADTVAVGFYSVLLSPPYYTNYDVQQSWNAGTNILTCTPSPAFLSGTTNYWSVDGADLATGTYMDSTNGYFTTSSGGGSGSGTNAITEFSVGKSHHYNQTSTALPVLDASTPYGFIAITSLSSNRSATNVTLTLPTSAVSNLVQNFFAHELFTLFANFTSSNTSETTFPSGSYTFDVQAVTSNQLVAVNFPGSLTQPGAPHVSNYTAAQAVDASQAFSLLWDAFPGEASSNYIYVAIGSAYTSPSPGAPGALYGTATAFNIPAGTLQPGSNYDSTIGFYHAVNITNGNSYVTTVYRATFTDFTLTTVASLGSLRLTNAAYAPSNFNFDVLCSVGQTVTVEYRTNLVVGPWQTLLTTNSPGSRFHAVAPQAVTNHSMFFRARTGP